MPLVDDYSPDEEEDRPQPSGGGIRGGIGGAPSTGAPQATTQKESEFVPWSRFVSANEEVATREAGKLGAQVQGDVDKALKGRDEAVGAQESAIQSNYKTKPVPQFGSIAGASAGSSFGESKRQNALTQPQAAGMMGANTVAEQPAPSGFSAVAMPEKVVDPDKLNTTVADGGWKTEGAGLAGGKDLESQLGKDKWGSLVGDTMKAASEANALGSEGGIQALLGKQQGPATAFDAALIGGAGGEQFRDLNKQYGQGQLSEGLVNANKGAQDRWASLMGDIEAASAARDEEIGAAQSKPGAKSQAERDADAAANRGELEAARKNFSKGMQAYGLQGIAPGHEGAVNGLGTQKQFLDALKSGAQYGDGVAWDNLPGVKEQMATASQALGVSPDVLAGYFEKMTPAEWMDFWLLGVVPPWMEGVNAYGYGKPGGWQSPYIEGVAGYGDDGGMWNAITNMWKGSVEGGAKAALGGPGGIVSFGAESATKGFR